MKWIARDPTRFLREREEIEKLAAESDWLKAVHWRIDKDTLALVADVDVEIHGVVREIDLTYPDLFPDTPAYIRPRDRSQRWSIHQYGEGGSFCLEWRADNWNSEITGADLLRSFYKLLLTEQHPAVPSAVPSAHRLTQGQEMRSASYRVVTTPALIDGLVQLPPNTISALWTRTLLHETTSVAFITEVAQTNGTLTAVSDVPKGIDSYLLLLALKSNGFVVKTTAALHNINVRTADDLVALPARLGVQQVDFVREAESNSFGDILLVVADPRGVPTKAWGLNDGNVHEYVVVDGASAAARIPPAYENLQSRRIAIIGLGSIGSKVAVSLARSGCRKFLLVDDDILLPGNICRNELSWASVGVHKAHAVREMLLLIGTRMKVDVRVHRLAGQESSIAAASALKAIASCDLIIDASANAHVFTLLAAVAKANARPICWGELFAGGIGGLIARADPKTDPGPLAVRNAILAHLATLPPAPYARATEYDVNEQSPLIADDADVSHIASALTRMVLDTLLSTEPTAFPYPAYLIGLRSDWVFSGAFDTQPIAATGEGWDRTEAAPNDRVAALSTLVELLEEAADDHTDTPAADTRNDQASSS